MTAEQLYTALTHSAKGLTPKRLERAQQRADSPAVYQAVIDRLKAEGKL